MDNLCFAQLKNSIIRNKNEITKVVIIICILFSVCILFSSENQLLLHTSMEAFSITIAFCISIISIAFLKIHKQGYFIILGFAFLFVGLFDFLHAMSYPGMGVLKLDGDYNLSAQFFIIARYIECISFLLFCFLMDKRIKVLSTFTIYFIVSVILFLSVFYWRIFPECYTKDYGLTYFKIVSELIISGIQIINVYMLLSKRAKLSKNASTYMILFFITAAAAEILFTTYSNINDASMLAGNILRVVSYYFMYKALIKTSLLMPFEMLNNVNVELECKNLKLQWANKELERENMERKRIEEELSESENRYRILIESMPDALYIYRNGEIVFVNKAAIDLLRAPDASEIIGKPLYYFLLPDYREMVKQRINTCKKEKTVAPLREMTLLRFDGTTVDIESTGVYLSLDKEEIFLSVTRDISERKHIEKLQMDIMENKRLLDEAAKYDMMKNEFMANVSHELRTPLNIIFSAVQLLELNLDKSSNDEGTAKHLKVMRQNCYRLLRLVNNIIDITKIESGFFELHLSNCDIVNVIEDVTMSVVDFAEHKGITVLFDTEVEEMVIACDPELIEQAMLNILSNAVKFTGTPGNISVNLYDKGDSVSISIKDDGIGIPDDKVDVIFDRFIQVDKSLTRMNEGSGIGLSLVKLIIQIHKGTITVNSELGKGSEFTITLPKIILPEDEICIDAQKSINQHSYAEKIKIEFSDVNQ